MFAFTFDKFWPAYTCGVICEEYYVMSSGRAAHRRVGTPSTLLPNPKPALSLEEWEARAPLGDIEIKSINAIKSASENIPLPLKVHPIDYPVPNM